METARRAVSIGQYRATIYIYMRGYIYKITNIKNQKAYIGQTIQELKRRISQHYCDRSNSVIFKRAIKKYGKASFFVTILHILENDDERTLVDRLNVLEKQEIEEHKTLDPFGYNIEIGGKNRPGRRWKTPPFKGKKHTEDAKAKIALANTGLKRPWMKDHATKMTKDRQKPIKCNETGETWPSIKMCADSFKCKPEAIHRVLRGVRNKYKNKTFSYLQQAILIELSSNEVKIK